MGGSAGGGGGTGGGEGGGGEGGGEGGGDGGGGEGGDGGGATPEHTALFAWLHERITHSPPLLLVSTCVQSSHDVLASGWPEAQLVYMPAVSGTS